MERLKGLTIGLDLDTIKVERGLQGLKATLRNVNSEMRANMSAFDYADRSIGKYETRLSGLNKKLEVQKVATQEARKEMEYWIKEKGEASVEAEKATKAYYDEVAALNNLERYISRTADELRNLQREQAETSSMFYKSGDAILSFSSGLEGISDKVKSVGSDLTKYLTVPITTLVATFGGMGFKRAMAIEQVQMMMEHISDDAAEYEMRMKNIVDLVTDTRYGSAEIGAEYAKFIGASSSDESAKLFSKVAMNLSAFTSDDSLIQQIGGVFTKALQSGKIDGMMINQFTNAGVDILKVLGNTWGMERDAVREKLADGDFDIEDVLGDLSHGVLEGTKGIAGETKAMGGMLEKSGDTLSGQLKNFFAAVSISGERMIKQSGLFDSVKDSLAELRNMLKSGELDAVLLPTFQGLQQALEALVETTKKMFKWFSSLDDSTKETIGKFVGLAAVIGPVLVGIGTFGGIIAKFLAPLGKFLKFIAKSKAIRLFGVAAGEAGGKVGILTRVVGALTGPIGWIITALSILATGLIIAYKKSDTFRGIVDGLGASLMETFGKFREYIQPAIDAVVKFFSEMKEKFTSFMASDGDQLLQAFKNIGTGIKVSLEFIWDMIKVVFGWIKDFIVFIWPAIELVIRQSWKIIEAVIGGALDMILGLVKIFSGIFTGDFSKIWEGVKDIFWGAVDAIWGIMKALFIDKIIGGIVTFGKFLGDKFSDLWKGIKERFTKGTDDAQGKWTEWIDGIKESISNFVGGVKEFFQPFIDFFFELFETLSNVFSEAWDAITSIAEDAWTIIKNVILGPILLLIDLITGDFEAFSTDLLGIWTNISDAGSNIWETIKTTFVSIVTTIAVFIVEKFVAFKNKLIEIIISLAIGISEKVTELRRKFIELIVGLVVGAINKFTEFKTKAIEIVAGLIISIPAKISELRTKLIQKIVDMFVGATQKFVDFKNDAKDKMREIATTIVSTIAAIDLKQIGKDIVMGLIRGILSKVTAVKDAIKDVTGAITGKLKSILKIESPSKVTTEIGEWTGEGVELGIVKSVRNVGKAAGKLAEAAIPNRTNTAKQLALYGKSISDKTNPIGFGGESEYLKQIVSYLAEQVADTKEMVYLLMQILAKENVAVVEFEHLYKTIKKTLNEDEYAKNKRRR